MKIFIIKFQTKIFFLLRHTLAYLPLIIAAEIQGLSYKMEICKVIMCRTQSNYRQQITRGDYNRNKFADVKLNKPVGLKYKNNIEYF